ncbi:XdhC family protein [Halomicrococcus gelatinilyticus]|uniref:XdhC family protein n=1 Tax=Halomicrococcus gelatinilyticus TaxID=1702103 RepID=UPI002E1081B0
MSDDWSAPATEVLRRVGERVDAAKTDAVGTDVLATVVDVADSAYRRPGAKVLFTADGRSIGSVAAGGFETELRPAADAVRESGRPALRTYDLSGDASGDAPESGASTSGVVDVLLEPLTASHRPMAEAFAAGEAVVAVTVLSTGGDALARGDRAYYHPTNDRFEAADGDEADWPVDDVADVAGDLAGRDVGDVVCLDRDGDRLELFVERVAAPADCVVFGTGHDVAPVVELAALSDLRVTVVSFREAVDVAERLPAADRTVTTSPADVRDALDLDDRTYAVLMSHDFEADRVAVEELLASPVPYVGVMGPAKRAEEMLAAFGADVEGELDRLYAPVGLDLGGGSPHRTALGVVAEVLAVHAGRDPGHLRDAGGPIHDRVDLDR